MNEHAARTAVTGNRYLHGNLGARRVLHSGTSKRETQSERASWEVERGTHKAESAGLRGEAGGVARLSRNEPDLDLRHSLLLRNAIHVAGRERRRAEMQGREEEQEEVRFPRQALPPFSKFLFASFPQLPATFDRKTLLLFLQFYCMSIRCNNMFYGCPIRRGNCLQAIETVGSPPDPTFSLSPSTSCPCSAFILPVNKLPKLSTASTSLSSSQSTSTSFLPCIAA